MSLSKSVVQKKHRLTSSKLLLASFWHLQHWVAEIIFERINSFLAAHGDFCCLLITFANSLDTDQDRQNAGPGLYPNHRTIWYCSWRIFLKKAQKHGKYLACRDKYNLGSAIWTFVYQWNFKCNLIKEVLTRFLFFYHYFCCRDLHQEAIERIASLEGSIAVFLRKPIATVISQGGSGHHAPPPPL